MSMVTKRNKRGGNKFRAHRYRMEVTWWPQYDGDLRIGWLLGT